LIQNKVYLGKFFSHGIFANHEDGFSQHCLLLAFLSLPLQFMVIPTDGLWDLHSFDSRRTETPDFPIFYQLCGITVASEGHGPFCSRLTTSPIRI
jgi:hypothetical protein